MKCNLGIITAYTELEVSSLFTLANTQASSPHESLSNLDDKVTILLWTFILLFLSWKPQEP